MIYLVYGSEDSVLLRWQLTPNDPQIQHNQNLGRHFCWNWQGDSKIHMEIKDPTKVKQLWKQRKKLEN